MAERPPMVIRFDGSLTFLAARTNFCRAVSGKGVAELRNRVNVAILGWQHMNLCAGVQASDEHCGRTAKSRVAGATGISPGSGWLTGGNPGWLFEFGF